MSYNYLKESLQDYIGQLSAKSPCPGGGSASILSLALANALILMVCNFSVECKRIAKVSQKVSREILNKASEIQPVLNKCIEEDSAIYKAIQDAMKNLKNNPQQYKENLIKSINLHMEMLKYCKKMLEWNFQLVEHANPYLISDIGVSASLIEGAAKATKVNILVNLCEIKDCKHNTNVLKELEETSSTLINEAQQVISMIENKMLSKVICEPEKEKS
ncbi:MAG: cyclodeaminase/cyclohydrolase family protein [Candidatus Omnitrophica bacterium]|nr:cyclodeaminase/cyclohydrolase family protein [Candidatus Omnitrophota bacterium]